MHADDMSITNAQSNGESKHARQTAAHEHENKRKQKSDYYSRTKRIDWFICSIQLRCIAISIRKIEAKQQNNQHNLHGNCIFIVWLQPEPRVFFVIQINVVVQRIWNYHHAILGCFDQGRRALVRKIHANKSRPNGIDSNGKIPVDFYRRDIMCRPSLDSI